MSGSRLSFTLNGAPLVVDLQREQVEATATTLSQWLRQTGRTGTKEGCAEGDCGACTVLVSDLDATGSAVWRAVNSCIAFLPSLAGRDVVTVEGLAGAALHPVQAAMVKHGGSQCGYCTPGFIMAMAEGYQRPELVADGAGLCAQLDGNICRCTGYRPIRDAMLEALRARDLLPPPQPKAASGTELPAVIASTPTAVATVPATSHEVATIPTTSRDVMAQPQEQAHGGA